VFTLTRLLSDTIRLFQSVYSMLRGAIGCVGKARSIGVRTRHQAVNRAWVGCSHWTTTPFRPLQPFSTRVRDEAGGLFDQPELGEGNGPTQDAETHHEGSSNMTEETSMNVDSSHEGVTIDQIDPHSLGPDDTTPSPASRPNPPSRPTLPTSIKKLNRLLSHSRDTTIPESDLIEKFVKGRGPGGQAINKTNSSVSLIHIPTGIRIQSQPTRSREENRKIARKILGEGLDLLRARAGSETDMTGAESVTGGANSGPVNSGTAPGIVGQSRKDKERVLSKQFSRDEIRWEKERRRKSNKAKKAKKKHGTVKSDGPSEGGDE